MLPRAIVHLDADAFFASVEQASDPRLRGKPIAVGGEKRGIIASASYEARKFGIYTPMPTVMARRLCPKLVLLPGDFEKYELFSRLMFSYAYDFTPDVEIGSIDEGYFDLTGARKPAVGIAQTIRQTIRDALKLPVSEGIGSNKLVSQIASKLKKPSAFEFVPPGNESNFLSPLENKWLPGIGPKTGRQLNTAGLARIGQIAQTPVDLLGLVVGRMAPQLRRFSLGIDERPVIPLRAPAKSYSEQETFAADTTDEEFIEATLCRMADKLMTKVRADHKSIRTFTVKVRYNDMDEEQAGESLLEPTDLETDIYSKVSALLRKAWNRRVSLRLVSLKLSNVYDGRFGGSLALDATTRLRAAQQRAAGAVDELRHKHGRSIILRGHDFLLRARQAAEPAAQVSEPVVVDRPRPADSTARQPSVPMRFPARSSPGADFRLRLALAPPPRRSFSATCIPLNVHSYYSFLNSTLSTQAVVDLAKANRLPAIALTDTNNLHGAVAFAQAAAAAGIKPIIGAELNWQSRRLCLYVENQAGYRNLCRMLNAVRSRESLGRRGLEEAAGLEAGDTTGLETCATAAAPGYAPQLFDPDLFAQTDGLIAVSPSADLARFFPGRFYFQVNSPEAFAKRPAPLPCVASFPVHYHSSADRWKYDVVQSIRTLTLLRQQHPEKRLDGDYHFRSPAEMAGLFAAQPELIANSEAIAERCNFRFELGKPQFPSYPPPDNSTPATFLRKLVLEGLRRRYPHNHARVRPQVEEELAIIMDVGYEEYFLVMWDILQECRRRGIEWITRGSAADSLACYCLEISSVCPLRFDLYFRRFLNKDRMALNKLPDIDVDFPHDRKDDVIDLVFEKYGPDRAAVVGGFSTFQSRSAFAEVAKVLGVSEYQVRRLTERFPYYSRAGALAEVVSDSQECRDLPLAEEPYRTALHMAEFLDGFPRYPKMHPCGLVLSRQPMHEITPCFTSAKGYPTTHFDMDSVEAVGLIKMDILAQGGLAAMRDVRQMVDGDLPEKDPVGAAGREKLINFAALEPWQDPQVWELIASGNARAVHHIESPAMISLCRMCNVRDIDTLIAIVSVIRPGAANESKKMEFARRYQGLSPVQYPHPSLEPCLRSTYGLVVYEEHILQICEAFAGLPPGRADILRRALGKEKTGIIDQIQVEFANCARRLGRTEEEITAVWNLVAGFRGYAFCKAHSTAYGVEAYQSAWLKRYFPVEFMAAVLSNGKGFYNPLVYILECHRLGIPLLPPSVNDPGPHFIVAPLAPPHPLSLPLPPPPPVKAIRVPVLQLKSLTSRTRENLLQQRQREPFVSLADFFLRVHPLAEEMEILIRAGAFDCFGKSRTAQYWEFKALAQNTAGLQPPRPRVAPLSDRSTTVFDSSAVALAKAEEPVAAAADQLWLLPPGNIDHLPSVPLSEPSRLERLRAEEELLGYPASGHPLELFPDILWESYCPINRLREHLGEEIVTCGLVIEQRMFHQVTGEPMKFLTIADWTGIIETELFARTYQSYGLNTIRYRVLEITATVEPFENNRGHTLRVLRAAKPRARTR